MQTMKMLKRIGVLGAIVASLFLCILALFFPAFKLQDNGSFSSVDLFLFGWMGPAMGGGFAWYANVFVLIAWAGMAFSKYRIASGLGVLSGLIAAGLALSAFTLKTITIDNTADIVGYHAGFYLWLASVFITLIGSIFVFVLSLSAPKEEQTAK